MFLSNLQTDEHIIFLNLKIWILVTENCLEIEDALKFDSLDACKRLFETSYFLGVELSSILEQIKTTENNLKRKSWSVNNRH